MPTALLAHDPDQAKDDAPFFTLPDISGIWGGPPVRQSEVGGWAVSGNTFEQYGKGPTCLNPVSPARNCCYAVIQSHSAEDNVGQRAGAV